MNEDNKIFKTNEISIEISPVKKTVDSQRAQYYSYDENSGLQRIHILKDGQPLGLPEGSEIRLSAVKLSGSKQMMIYTPEIEDRVNGIVTFVIPKEFLGYSGQIRCTLYIDFSSDQTLHAGYFYINMGISDIDANLPEFSDSYWQRWTDFESEATTKMQELERRIDEQTEIFNNADVYNKTEIEEKLEPFALRTDVAEVSAQLAQTAKNYLTQTDYVDEINKLSSVKNMNVKLGNQANKTFNVNVELSSSKILTYEFAKNANDDYILALGGYIGTANRSTKISDMVNATEIVGVVEKTYAPNYIVNEVGTYITANFVGKKITFYHYCENRSGVWEFILDEGTGSERKVTKSAYSDVAMYKETVLFDELEKKNHTIKAIFKGADPQNPPSSGNARGYFYYGGTRPQDTFRTFNVYNDVFEGQKDDELLYSYSNKDFAFEIRPHGSAEAYNFVPEHNAEGSAFKVSDPKILVDGDEVTAWRDDSFMLDVGTVQLVQHVKGYHLSDLNNPLMEIITYHTIKNGVLDIKGKVKFLRATEVKNGYGMMFPYWASFGDIIKTSTGNAYAIKKTGYEIENWQETDDVKSIAVLNTSGKDNLALAITFDNFNQTMRKGEEGRGNPFSWIEHRSSSMGKIYHKQFENVVIQVNYEYRFGGRFAVSYVNDIGQFIS
ncbi:BppU family phage baseplate upper protein [Enterococcus songbeiensis]|uniref:BppU family phage baseplate upper protein n=1 Tax=Enterococcus songbeiensis TaxID=2559927 RepID=UPI0010F8C45F|nr:BppU family phage baseplate upper protein [Enterococcus songbeiensis]